MADVTLKVSFQPPWWWRSYMKALVRRAVAGEPVDLEASAELLVRRGKLILEHVPAAGAA